MTEYTYRQLQQKAADSLEASARTSGDYSFAAASRAAVWAQLANTQNQRDIADSGVPAL